MSLSRMHWFCNLRSASGIIYRVKYVYSQYTQVKCQNVDVLDTGSITIHAMRMGEIIIPDDESSGLVIIFSSY